MKYFFEAFLNYRKNITVFENTENNTALVHNVLHA